MALPDFLVFGLVAGFLFGADLALAEGVFLPDVLVLTDLDSEGFLVGLTSANLGEVLVPLVLLLVVLVVLGLVEADFVEAPILTVTLVGLVLELVLVPFLVVDLLEVDLVSGM